jgi:hypothetical protein
LPVVRDAQLCRWRLTLVLAHVIAVSAPPNLIRLPPVVMALQEVVAGSGSAGPARDQGPSEEGEPKRQPQRSRPVQAEVPLEAVITHSLRSSFLNHTTLLAHGVNSCRTAEPPEPPMDASPPLPSALDASGDVGAVGTAAAGAPNS